MANREYLSKLADPRWQKKRLEIFNRDRFTCRDCDAAHKELQVHHCYYHNGDPWTTDDQFLLTLCKECHKERQRVEKCIKVLIGELFSITDIESLRCFEESALRSITKAATSPGEFAPEIWDAFEVEYLSNVRWWQEAYANKKSRQGYENVIGRKVKWRDK